MIAYFIHTYIYLKHFRKYNTMPIKFAHWFPVLLAADVFSERPAPFFIGGNGSCFLKENTITLK